MFDIRNTRFEEFYTIPCIQRNVLKYKRIGLNFITSLFKSRSLNLYSMGPELSGEASSLQRQSITWFSVLSIYQ